jgi:hypothetical protein
MSDFVFKNEEDKELGFVDLPDVTSGLIDWHNGFIEIHCKDTAPLNIYIASNSHLHHEWSRFMAARDLYSIKQEGKQVKKATH